MSTFDDIRIVRAGPSEIKRLAIMLPQAADMPTQADFFAAINGHGALQGGAALILKKKRGAAPGPAVFHLGLLDGAPAAAGEMLIQAMKVLARRGDADWLQYSGGVMDDSEAANMLERCHFTPKGEPIVHFKLRLDAPEWDRFDRTYARIKARGKIPAHARILPLHEVSMAPLSELMRRTLVHGGEHLQMELLNPETCSIGIQIGPVLRGAHVVHLQEREAHTSQLAVDPACRGSWIYTVLIAEVLKHLRVRSLESWNFKTNPGIHRAILNFARTMEAESTGTEQVWGFPL